MMRFDTFFTFSDKLAGGNPIRIAEDQTLLFVIPVQTGIKSGISVNTRSPASIKMNIIEEMTLLHS